MITWRRTAGTPGKMAASGRTGALCAAALSATVLSAAGLSAAALGATTTAAAAASSSEAAAPSSGALTVAARVDLGRSSMSAIETMADAEAPDGTYYFASSAGVDVVRANAAPVVVLRGERDVTALAATDSDLYVQVGLGVVDYSVPTLRVRRGWTLTPDKLAPKSAPTSAGLLAGGGVAWSWDDWSTDASGFEYATLDELSSAAAVRLIDTDAFPADMAADATGLYYESEKGSKGYLVHVTPAGAEAKAEPTQDTDAPIALAGGSVDLFAVHEPSGTPVLDRFSETTLAPQASMKEREQLPSAVETSLGMLTTPCNSAGCAGGVVARLDPLTASTSGALAVPGLVGIVHGESPAVLAFADGSSWLLRLAVRPTAAP